MQTEHNKQIVRSFYEAGNRGDMEACMALFADDIVWTNMGTTPLSGRFVGKQALMEQLLGPLFGSLKAGIHMEIERLVAEGDWVVAQTRGSAETLDGRRYDNRYCWVVRLAEGLIAEVTEYLDTALVDAVFGDGRRAS